MAYPRDEQETVLVYEATTDTWRFYSTVPKHIRKVQSITDVEILEIDEHGNPSAVKAELSPKQVSMKKERVMTEEQRQAAAERLRNLRN